METSADMQKMHLEGIRLFNTEHYWHAHEQWEMCWLASSEPEATFYKGIIQAAAALVHWQRNNPRGIHLNWAKSRPKLVALPPVMHGLDVTSLIRDMDRFVISGGKTQILPRISYQFMVHVSK
ncbi:MAG: DUF309 domain-containing protein [Chloroflexota bacterium]